jgi:ATP-dependent helicase/nuclease subunit A
VLEELPKTIERLQDVGFDARDIAVLVRKSDDGKQVIERLMRYKHSSESNANYCYDAISNESLFLGNSSAIRLLINTIKYGLNHDDVIARAEISFNYHQLKSETFIPSQSMIWDLFNNQACYLKILRHLYRPSSAYRFLR